MRQKYLKNHFELPAIIEWTIPNTIEKPILYLTTMGILKERRRLSLSIYDQPYLFYLQRNSQKTTMQSFFFLSNLYKQIIQSIIFMDLEGLVVTKGIKGKQNKKKWNKNIDVSGLLDKIQNDLIQQTRKKHANPLVVEDTTQKIREDLDPNRFKNRPKSQPKVVYDNSYKRVDLLGDGMMDAWSGEGTSGNRNKQELKVTTIIKPSSGHSYNPREEDIEQIVEEVIEYEKERPRKQKKIKKLVDKKVVKRVRNKKLRRQFLQARQRKKERQTVAQLNSIKKIKKELKQKQKEIQKKIQQKEKRKEIQVKDQATGKVREGPKIGKIRYKYKQYIPQKEEIKKKLSKVAQTQQLLKQQYDGIFRRGIIEPRTIKVQKNKRKNIKVIQKFEEQNREK